LPDDLLDLPLRSADGEYFWKTESLLKSKRLGRRVIHAGKDADSVYAVQTVIDPNEHGLVVHENLKSSFIFSIFGMANDNLIHDDFLYVDCGEFFPAATSSSDSGKFRDEGFISLSLGSRNGSRRFSWLGRLWADTRGANVIEGSNGQRLCKTKIRFTREAKFSDSIIIGRMLMLYTKKLEFDSFNQIIRMHVIPTDPATRIMRLNKLPVPICRIPTFSWPSVEYIPADEENEGDGDEIGKYVIKFPINSNGSGEWCLFNRHAREMDEGENKSWRILFFRCRPDGHHRPGGYRRITIDNTNLDIQSRFWRDDIADGEFATLEVYEYEMDEQKPTKLEIIEGEYTLEIVMRYMPDLQLGAILDYLAEFLDDEDDCVLTSGETVSSSDSHGIIKELVVGQSAGLGSKRTNSLQVDDLAEYESKRVRGSSSDTEGTD